MSRLLHKSPVAGGHLAISESEFNGYLGLEVGMSIWPMNDIAELWSDRHFLRQSEFIETTHRVRFQQTHGALKLHPPYFHKRFAQFAVPIGVSSIDETTVRTRLEREKDSDKYGVRFYAVVGWSSLYVHSLRDNPSGNKLPSTPAEWYSSLFPTLRTPLYNTLRSNTVIYLSRKIQQQHWIATIGLQTQAYRSPTRIVS
ncbi:Hypothetical protein PHPALM_9642 [Phytophthora palmivora]|uniref:Uncharacterized protein n=1 Tax=Phytophthora palmivora TaxID=4796 RepID=A0A2P4Y6S1_9STRA|nr:Hypothetical protein PHPALM_9642 [Phytophthora palmivora]